MNQQQTYRKPWSSAIDSESTGELDHRKLFIKGDSTKSTQKAQRTQQATPMRWEKTGLWGTTSTLMIFVIMLIKAFFLVIPVIIILREKRKRTPGQNPEGIDWKSPKSGSGSLRPKKTQVKSQRFRRSMYRGRKGDQKFKTDQRK